MLTILIAIVVVGGVAFFFVRSPRSWFNLLGWLYLARVSVLGFVVLLLVPAAARWWLPSLCIGPFDLSSRVGSFFVGLLLPIAAWVVFLSGAMVFAYGAWRSSFELDPPPRRILVFWRVIFTLAVVFNIWTIFGATGLNRSILGWVCLGIITSLTVIWLVEEVHRQQTKTWLGGNLYLLWHAVETLPFEKVKEHQKDFAVDDRWTWLLRGYREKRKEGWHFLPGHFLLLIVSGVFLFLNLGLYNVEIGERTAMIYLLLLFTTFVLVLGGLTFFFDAYRIPPLSVLLVWLVLVGRTDLADHVYRVWPREGGKANEEEVATPAQILEDAGRAGRPVVLVAIAGGGIQSAAWSTRVLTGLEEAVLRAKKEDRTKYAGLQDFAGSVQCLSGVSGGSTGAMFFVAGYGDGGLPAPRLGSADPPVVNVAILPKILEAAEASSLGHAVWGMAYPDLRRAWFPFWIGDPYLDRARELETKWAFNASRSMESLGESLENCSLADWQKDVREGKRPATIFNGTIVETGEKISFSTAPLRRPYGGQREFVSAGKDPLDRQLYPGADLRITTAARLSATFPVISPGAHPGLTSGRSSILAGHGPADEALKSDLKKEGVRHVVDGGYYENTGLGALVQWLDDGLTQLSTRGSEYWPPSILIIQIDGFPIPLLDSTGTPPERADLTGRGAIFQFASPLTALYNVRGAGHTASANRALDMLQARWILSDPKNVPPEGQQPPICNIQLVRFTIPVVTDNRIQKWWGTELPADPKSPPLSWHLRKTEKEGIEAAWSAFLEESSIGKPNKSADDKKLVKPPSDKKSGPGAWPVDNVIAFLNAKHSPVRVPAKETTAANAAPAMDR